MIVNRIYPSYFCGLPIVKGTYERQRAATLGGNESQERVCICFTNGPEHGEGKTRGNKCQRDFMARSNDFSLPRTTPRNNELRFASPFGKQRPAHRLLPHRQFLFDSSLVFSGGGEKRGKNEHDRCGYRRSTFLRSIRHIGQIHPLDVLFYIYMYYRILYKCSFHNSIRFM